MYYFRYGNMFLQYGSIWLIYCMWIFAKLKLWEVLLVIAICLLAALVYETHNAPGRYVQRLNSELDSVVITWHD